MSNQPINWKHSAELIGEGMKFVNKKIGNWIVEMFYRTDGGAMGIGVKNYD